MSTSEWGATSAQAWEKTVHAVLGELDRLTGAAVTVLWAFEPDLGARAVTQQEALEKLRLAQGAAIRMMDTVGRGLSDDGEEDMGQIVENYRHHGDLPPGWTTTATGKVLDQHGHTR
jgi:hypothetical protein